MKKYLFLLLSLFLLAACGNSSSSTVEYSKPAVEVEESTTYEEVEESSSTETEKSSGPDYVIKEAPNHSIWDPEYKVSGSDERGRKTAEYRRDLEYVRQEGALNYESWIVYDPINPEKYFVRVSIINGEPLMVLDDCLGLNSREKTAEFLRSGDGIWDLFYVEVISEEEKQKRIEYSYSTTPYIVDENWNAIGS